MPEARISPKVIFIGRVRAGMAHDSANRVSREAARFGVPESVTTLGALFDGNVRVCKPKLFLSTVLLPRR
jgi:hypothetical protein